MYESSVGIFSQYLGNLSDILDRAAAHAAERRIDPSILLRSRLYPNMYDLTHQVGEASRHVVLDCALLSGAEPPAFGDSEPDLPELTSRIATVIAFMQSLQPAACSDQRRCREGSRVHVPERFDTKIHRKIAATDVQRAAVLFSRYHGVRHPAP